MIKKVKDANFDIKRFYYDVICYITTTEGSNDTDWYTLIKSHNMYDN